MGRKREEEIYMFWGMWSSTRIKKYIKGGNKDISVAAFVKWQQNMLKYTNAK